jgi:hypothetical protein
MPIEYVLDHARQRLTIIGRDPVGEPDVVEWLERQAVEGAWAYGTLVDLRLVTWNPTTEEARRFLGRVGTLSATHGRRGPVAIVATQPVLFGMSRMYGALSDQTAGHVRAFYELAEAEHWLAEQSS